MEFETKLGEFKDYLTKIEYLGCATSVLYWDMRVYAPKKGVTYRSEVLGYLSGELYKLTTSNEMKAFLDYFSKFDDLDTVTKAMVEDAKKQYDQTKKIPEDKYKEYTILTSNAESAWQEAKEKNDFSIFQPYLEKIVEFKKEFIEYWGYKDNKYDTLLDFFEPGITVEKLDEVFKELRDAIIALLNKINNSSVKVDKNILTKEIDIARQDKFSKEVLEKLEYDFEAGRVDETEHPFTIEFGNKDVRITTHYFKNNFISGLLSNIHEGGHAIYEQDVPDSLRATGLASGASMGIHESQSRFYENILARGKEFWKYFYPILQERFPEYKEVPFVEFFKAINLVEPSLIRTEADELTYSIHVIIRYEIEKMLINGKIQVKDLPRVWNEKYKEYLGVEPSTDSEGVLQDVHWAGGDFGYFPSYALGNLYGAQFLNKMRDDIKDLDEQIEKGNFGVIHSWLKENVHKHGAVYKPSELIKMVTGEELKAKYFIEYLNKKYAEVYDI
ncbi:carboxypeptidase M32 [Haloimpatiens massiliensis]|uniref:carboxypeptidase M32 n=1 Tax=Haloimpatiens massiliensis TaxID=1658110 RepID=UPI000C840251|nr:carboxypeptidase M32 [Haloimpatiens massiliensis]